MSDLPAPSGSQDPGISPKMAPDQLPGTHNSAHGARLWARGCRAVGYAEARPGGEMHLQLPPRGCGEAPGCRGGGGGGLLQGPGLRTGSGAAGGRQGAQGGLSQQVRVGARCGEGAASLSPCTFRPSSWWRGPCGGRSRDDLKRPGWGSGGLGLRTGTFHSGHKAVWTGAAGAGLLLGGYLTGSSSE